MITLHRFHHDDEEIHLNPDLIASIEARPDTVVRLTTGERILVAETPDEVTSAVCTWRARLMAEAMNLKPA